ncbi:hypothetical protein CW714_01105 [Methanophagales archaeon]|nr:MAG: hypothetical protein CW714_01105 [Methanophagales archaeon]
MYQHLVNRRRGVKMDRKVENKKTSRMTNTSVFIAYLIVVLILIIGLSGVARAFHVGVIPHADLIQSYTSSGGTPEYKDSNTDLVYKVQQGDMLTFSITLNPGYTNLECEWTVRKGSAVLTSATGTSFSWTVPSENSTWEIEAEVFLRDAVGNPVGKDAVSWSITTVDVVTVNPGESIQDAIDSICPEGGVVELAAGIHNVSARTTMPFSRPSWSTIIDVGVLVIGRGNITIKGHGIDATIVQTDDPSTTIFGIMNCTNVNIQNMKIYGNFDRYNGKVPGINIHGIVNDSAFSDLYVENFKYCIYSQYNGDFDNITIKDSTFAYARGGVLWLSGMDNSLIENCDISGSASWFGLDFNTNCHNNVVRNCTSRHNGNNGFRIGYSKTNNNTLENCIAYNNVYGYLFQGSPIPPGPGNFMKGCVAYNNIEGVHISDAYADQGLHISNCLIYNNTGHGIGSELWHNKNGNIWITETTIVNNGGDGIYNELLYNFYVKNCIIAGNVGYGLKNAGGGSITSSYNDVWGNALGNYNNTTSGTGDISEDPLFADPDNGDFHLKSQAGRWNGTDWVNDNETSPCIDAGDPNSSYSNEIYPHGQRINIGAYGNTSEASKSPYHKIYLSVPMTIYSNGEYSYPEPPITYKDNQTVNITFNVSDTTNLTINSYTSSQISFTATNTTTDQKMNITVYNGTFIVVNGKKYEIKKDGIVQQTKTASYNKVVFTDIPVGSDYVITESGGKQHKLPVARPVVVTGIAILIVVAYWRYRRRRRRMRSGGLIVLVPGVAIEWSSFIYM